LFQIISHSPSCQAHYKDYGRFKEILNRVTAAALKRKIIEIVYYTMSRKKETRRRVDPYRVWFFNRTFYLIGLCHMGNEVRIEAERMAKRYQGPIVAEEIQTYGRIQNLLEKS
jgi:hypothetical protein